jgi:hypothetical protein
VEVCVKAKESLQRDGTLIMSVNGTGGLNCPPGPESGCGGMTKKPQKEKEIEFEPDAMERFRRAVDVVAKSPPQHRTKPRVKKTKRVARKKPVK